MNLVRATMACVALLAASSCSKNEGSKADKTEQPDSSILARASATFSDIPFESAELPSNPELVAERSSSNCETNTQDDCTFLDKNGVEHHYFDGLKVKSITGEGLAKDSISAFGLDQAQSKETTLARVSQFLGSSDFQCEDVREEFETGIDTVCNINVAEGWATFHFFEDKVILIELSSGQYI